MSGELEKRTLRKVSLRIIPFIMLLYFMVFIDRVNIGFASLEMNKDLGFSPAVFGFAEWNGRSLTDNAPNVMFSIAANTPIRLGIGKESVTSKPSERFPYVPVALEETRASAA